MQGFLHRTGAYTSACAVVFYGFYESSELRLRIRVYFNICPRMHAHRYNLLDVEKKKRKWLPLLKVKVSWMTSVAMSWLFRFYLLIVRRLKLTFIFFKWTIDYSTRRKNRQLWVSQRVALRMWMAMDLISFCAGFIFKIVFLGVTLENYDRKILCYNI